MFREGLKLYFEKHQYRNTKTEDLWESLNKAALHLKLDKSVADVMSTWTQQMGFPVVSVRPGSQDGAFILEQKRFLADGSSDGKQRFFATLELLLFVSSTFISTTFPIRRGMSITTSIFRFSIKFALF